MAKRKQTTRTPSERPTPSRQEGRQAQRDASKHREKPVLPSARRFTRQAILPILVLGVLVIASYLPAMLWGGFVWDDSILIDAKPVQDVSGLWQIWFSPSAIEGEGHYWPLVYTTFWLEHKLWEFDPTGYHIVNVLLHLANTLLLWHLMRRLSVPGAWVVAAVFAVHPLHVESVAWVIERKDVLSGLFYLAAVLAWMRFVEQPRRGWYVGSLVLYVAGLLSKSIVITLPVALLIWHWWQQGRVTSADLLRLVPFGVVGLVIVVGDLLFYQSREALSLDYSLIERTLIAARALWFYAGKLLWPSELAVIYPLWDIRVSDLLAWGYLVAAVALAVVLWHFRQRVGRGPLAGVLFFSVTLSPVLGFVDYGYMQYAFVADRFQYLAGLGIMAVVIGAVTASVGHLSDLWQKGAWVGAAVVLILLGMLTWRQASIYRDNETFNRHIIALNPQARNAHRNLGDALYKQRRYEEALDAYRIAAAQRPNYAKVHSNLGMVLNKLGHFEEAEIHLRRAIALNPQGQDARLNLGSLLARQRRYEEALAAVRVAVAQRPDFFAAHVLLGGILNMLGHFEEAETHLRRAIALNPQGQDARLNLGSTLYEQGRYEEALAAVRVAVAQRPDFFAAHVLLGRILNVLGRFEEAETHLRRAIALNFQDVNSPQDVNPFYELAKVLILQGRYEEAIDLIAQAALNPASFQVAKLHFLMGQKAQKNGQPEAAAEYYVRALEIDPYYVEALHRLAELRTEQQRYDEALELFQRLIDIDPSGAVAQGNIGIVLFYLGKSDEALQHLDQALSLDPTIENVRTNREAVLKAMEATQD